MRTTPQYRHVMLVIALGLSGVLMTMLVWLRLTVADPFLPLAGGSRTGANSLALLHFLGLLALWARPIRVLGRQEAMAALGLAVVGLATVPLASALSGIGGSSLMLLIGWHASWLLVLLGGGLALLGRVHSDGDGQVPWRVLWVIGAAAFAIGLMLYVAGADTGASTMLAKVALILMVPGAVLVVTARYYRGRRQNLLRGAGALGTLLAAAVATIR